MNKEDVIFENIKQKEATERVLALVRTTAMSHEVDELIAEIIKYASNIDEILKRNELKPRYLEKLGLLDNLTLLTLDDDLAKIDFRVKEVIEDLIKRINTRITIVNDNEIAINDLKAKYSVDKENIIKDIETAGLFKEDFLAD